MQTWDLMLPFIKKQQHSKVQVIVNLFVTTVGDIEVYMERSSVDERDKR